MIPFGNTEWSEWIEEDPNKLFNTKIRDDAPEEIKKQYEQFKKDHKEWKEKWSKK